MTPERWAQVKDVLYAVLDLEPEQRPGYLNHVCANEPSLRQEVESFILSHAQVDSDFLKTINPDSAGSDGIEARRSLVGRLIGPYRIVEEIGAGGMGEVYRAVRADDQYHKQVAIKVVRLGFNTDSGLRRFKAERQILASLDHPNISRLLDSGSTEDNLPYVVMELVEGQPIDEYCDGHNLSLVERLRLFCMVCAAVHYAHQHLVVHRDLKPGNILVTEEGVPKLLDFGIAKLLAPEILSQSLDRTATLMRAMTPEFASPEQVRGESITTASDVYSLGVVLYRLLTGCSPYRNTSEAPHEIAREICEAEPQKPSTAITCPQDQVAGDEVSGWMPPSVPAREQETRRRRRRLAGDLDNIVLMALRKEPQRRYSSVAQFSEDIRRHLEGLPVVARKDTVGYRASKFVARHKAGVAAAALVVIMLTAGLVALVREARIAAANQRRAEARFNDVRKLANSLLFDIHDSIRDLPGSTPARKLIVESALQYLDGLAKESTGDPSLQRELADAYERVGLVQGGYPGMPNLGDTAGALASFRKMLAIRQALTEAHPDSVKDQIGLAGSYRFLSDLQAAYLGDVQGGFENCMKAVAVTEELHKARPEDGEVQVELALDYDKLGDIEGGGNGSSANLANPQAGLDHHNKELALVLEVEKQKGTGARLQRWIAIIHYKLQNDLIQTGDRAAAMLHAQQATEIFGSLAKQNNNANAQRELGSLYAAIANLLEIDGQFAGALEYSRKQLQLIQPVVAADPKNLEYREDLANSQASVGYNLSKLVRSGEGIPFLRRGLAEMTELNRLGKNSETQVSLGGIQVRLGAALAETRNLAGALDSYARAHAIYKDLAAADLADLNNRLMSADIENRIAGVHLKQGDMGAALREYEEAFSISELLTSRTPTNVAGLYSLFESYAGLGDVSAGMATKVTSGAERSKLSTEAWDWYAKSLRTWEKIPNASRISPNGVWVHDPREIARRAKTAASYQPSPGLLSGLNVH
jgi:non-specific serine/threonine protein kinase/serine/threonine-protein kinase